MSSIKLTTLEYKTLMIEIKKFKLEVPIYFYENLSDWGRMHCYNGAGADDNSIFLRWILTKLLFFCPCTVFIHDCEYTYKRKASYIIDDRFYNNGKKEIKCRLSRWNVPGRLYALGILNSALPLIKKHGNKWS